MTDPWKEEEKKKYQEAKERGKSFFPYTIFKDTAACLVVFLILAALAYWLGADLEEMADPTDTTYNPRPEWYFLFLFQALKLFPGSLEAIAAIFLPALGVVFLLLLPFIDRGPKRHPLDRPVLTAIGSLSIAGFIYLTYLGMTSPLLNPIVEKDPQVLAGKQAFGALRCSYCHSIQGRGGIVGPDLTTIGAKRDREWLIGHFTDPEKVSPGSLMPKLNLLPDEIEALTAYMQTLGGEGPFTPQAAPLFAENCAVCHKLDGDGGDMGPDLTAAHSYRNKAYFYGYIDDPKKLNPSAEMPGFAESLTAAQIEDLARYLASSQRKKP
ncbi:MAG: c-type cytochrome [Deltaproteobacteria bacterium]|nr:c-type cytochrome [Deltaproteobacteria bacterium]